MTAPPLPPEAKIREAITNWLNVGQKVKCIEVDRVYRNVVVPTGYAIDLTKVHTISELVTRKNWTYFKVKGHSSIMFSAESAADGVELWMPVDE